MRPSYRSHRVRKVYVNRTTLLRLAPVVPVALAAFVTIPRRAPGAEPAKKQTAATGVYIAVGYGGRRMSSPDGVRWENDQEWEKDGGDDNFALFSVVHARGKFFATGGGASVGHVVTSVDGKAWKEVLKDHTRVIPILYGNNRFVVGVGNTFKTSSDGENWIDGGKLNYNRGLYYRRGVFGKGVFVFCGDVDIADGQPRGGWRATTADGVRIQNFVTNLPNTRSIAFGNGHFVLIGEHGYRETSTDGLNWIPSAVPTEDFHWIFWTGKQFILSGNKNYTSSDGITWTTVNANIPCEPQCAGQDGFIGVSWKTNLWRSPDGLNWTRVSDTGSNAFCNVVYGSLSASDK